MTSPTQQNYEKLNSAYEYFNKNLFKNTLPSCLITLQRHGRSYGYFAPDRFGERDGKNKIDEIALNPDHFRERNMPEIFSTLVHEMVHLWQQHFGKSSWRSYHDKEWGQKMRNVGLIPSNTGKPGGKETGQQMSHYIQVGGVFDVVCTALIKKGFILPYVDLWKDNNMRSKKAASKTKYTCSGCGLNAWAKPDVLLVCGGCSVELETV